MARIRTISGVRARHVIVAGRLGAGDMRRLEHACAPALVSARIDLVVDIARVTEMDRTAAAYLEHFATRGAIIKPGL